ncbi:hypothetical protein [Krasilnikoviella flava]|uniref:Transcriptional regulator, AbiEi antitoxin, Type IV TA system n=1 Tax=Krasilnikoviella flava TaxID=526729 RepID=A0A1T5L7T8_9MICO|nr:hypothetical protein [Krasilnikoviella flava]SKC71478.1 hypothetical protein SAMN04324258_2999 [Krasilnikoviella flava]
MSPFAVLATVPAPLPALRRTARDLAPARARRLGDLLAPAARTTGPLVHPDDVGGRAAWDVLVADGALEVVRGDTAVVAGTAVPPALRATLLAGALPTGAVIAGRTAAWVHAGRAACARPTDGLDLTYPAGGHRPEVWGAGLVWQAPLLRDDTVTLGGARVTAPLRTVVDVAVHVPGDDDAALLARVVADACGVRLPDAAALLERRARVVGRPRARRVLARAAQLPQPGAAHDRATAPVLRAPPAPLP